MTVQLILGLLPIIWLIAALSGMKMPGYYACPVAVLFAAAVAFFYKGMPPVDISTAMLEGVVTALWPILLVIIAALFIYNLMQETGAMKSIEQMLSGISSDKRVLLLIIGWGFGCFMEGMAGFGTAVAIPASILVRMGFDPILTVVSLLIVNSTPTAFGSVGVPTSTLASVTGLSPLVLSANTSLISALLMFLSPFLMIICFGKGVKALKGVWSLVFVSSAAFLAGNMAVAYFAGPQLPDIAGSLLSMAVTIPLALRRGDKEVPEEFLISVSRSAGVSMKEGVRAWFPFILVAVVLLLSSPLVPAVHSFLSVPRTSFHIYTGNPSSGMTLFWVNTPGVLIFLCAIAGARVQGADAQMVKKVFCFTLKSNFKTIITICSVLAVAKIMQYSGMTADVAESLVAATGTLFPLIAPAVGVLGGFVTGSGTSTGVLFGPMQVSTARAIGVSPAWLAGANSLGAGIGKMISPSNVAIGAAAAGLTGQENRIIGKVVVYVLLFTTVAGLCCYLFI